MNRNSGRTWINFKELRARLRAEEVLRLYKIEVHRKGDQHQGTCPLPSHAGRKDVLSFSMNLQRGIFQCFGCKAKGNLLEFSALMEGVDVRDGNALRKVGVKLQSLFFPEGASTREREPKLFADPPKASRVEAEGPAAVSKSVKATAKPPAQELLVKVNAPLDFALRGLDSAHQELRDLGLTEGVLSHFGLGYCSRGMLKNRLAIPLHDDEGKLIGYAGRLVDERDDIVGSSRYLFPERRERDGVVLDFDKSLFVYNGSRIKKQCDNLIVVQDIEAVWWLNQNGYTTSVALMGDQCSERQFELITRLIYPGGWVWIMCDGDAAGDELARSLLFHASILRPVRRIDCGKGRRPTDLSAEEVKDCFKF